MPDVSFPVRALLLAALLSTAAHSNPIDLPFPSNTITPCATAKCTETTTCKVFNGGAHCVPIDGVKCGSTLCEAGLTCCHPSCSACTKSGMACTAQICPYIPVDPPSARQCGSAFCKARLECCNPSCGICVEPGEGCTKELCAPTREQCGKTVCPVGLVCCNSSCGICTPPGGACIEQYCNTPTDRYNEGLNYHEEARAGNSVASWGWWNVGHVHICKAAVEVVHKGGWACPGEFV